ncbi:hypothetical protein MKX08_003001 [Trichoderma sp. CBMAI-0020]|nr:hypothetical protein MKX08_003001 [Trichoderma sp. CBMAI-0020]WOD46514.1 hypothetical protein [Trichoderma atroviride]
MKFSLVLAVLPMALATPVAIARSTGGDDVTCLRNYYDCVGSNGEANCERNCDQQPDQQQTHSCWSQPWTCGSGSGLGFD